MWLIATDIATICLYVLVAPLSLAEMDEPIDISCVGRRNHVLDGVRIGATWRIWFNYTVAMRAYFKLLCPLVTNFFVLW